MRSPPRGGRTFPIVDGTSAVAMTETALLSVKVRGVLIVVVAVFAAVLKRHLSRDG
jgi:hypothetical protein